MTKKAELVVALLGTIGCLAGIFLLPQTAWEIHSLKELFFSMQIVGRWTLIIGCGALAFFYWLLLFFELLAGEE